MALLILFSSSGLSLDVHFCQGKIKSLNLFGKAKSCAEIRQELSECHQNENATRLCSVDGSHDGCCKNQIFELDLDFDSGEVIAQNLTNTQLKFVKSFVLSYSGYSQASQTLQNYTNYYPPPLERDIGLLFQVFRL